MSNIAEVHRDVTRCKRIVRDLRVEAVAHYNNHRDAVDRLYDAEQRLRYVEGTLCDMEEENDE